MHEKWVTISNSVKRSGIYLEEIMNGVTLSYIVTTRNKLPYLKEAMKRLLENLKDDEEIIIADGASDDGSSEYLESLYKEGKLQYFISEPDKCEAHGYNKCLLKARGEIIKFITDDDAFNYQIIHECKKFMLSHPKIDAIAGNTAGFNLKKIDVDYRFEKCFQEYLLNEEKKFWFPGLGLMVRRDSLSLLGLFSTSTFLPDVEYSLRIMQKANLAWCSSLMSIQILNANSVSYLQIQKFADEISRHVSYYNGIDPYRHDSLWLRAKENIKKKVKKIIKWQPKNKPHLDSNLGTIEENFNICECELQKSNDNTKLQFLFKEDGYI